ncbi:uncharacterized protein LOC142981051 [Anticarsia gemmatalis]|uniref:uncharacterized protein LOC142981051 n=1 Tax=Anticarsia gemmatalis TaxID=129554 RepID=UPI003F777D2C
MAGGGIFPRSTHQYTGVLLSLLAGYTIISAKQCCHNNKVLNHPNADSCGASREELAYMYCKDGRYLLKDVVLDGVNVYTKEHGPNFVFVDNPSQYCLGEMYRNSSDISQGKIPVAVVCNHMIKMPEIVTQNPKYFWRWRDDYDY